MFEIADAASCRGAFVAAGWVLLWVALTGVSLAADKVEEQEVHQKNGLPAVFGLNEAIEFGLATNPRLRVASAQVAAARAGEKVAFAPFLPQVNFGYHFSGYTVPVLPASSFVPATLAGGAEGISLAEVGIHWILCDFGRTGGRYGQAVSETEIAALYLARARQTIAFEVSTAYFRLLYANAALKVATEALVEARRILDDTKARKIGGVADRDNVLRAEVEVSETEENEVAARERVYDAEARLNLAMGRGTDLPLEPRDVTTHPPFERTLKGSLELAVASRLELDVARRAVAKAAFGERAARGEFFPRIYVGGVVARVDSTDSLQGTLAAGGLHFDQSIFAGGRRAGELRQSRAHAREALANSQVILDNVAFEVNLAYRAIAATRQRIRLGELAVAQARENLRLTVVRYDNGDAIPTEIVDAQTALTRARTRYYSAVYDYLEALARLDYVTGGDQSGLIAAIDAAEQWSGRLLFP